MKAMIMATLLSIVLGAGANACPRLTYDRSETSFKSWHERYCFDCLEDWHHKGWYRFDWNLSQQSMDPSLRNEHVTTNPVPEAIQKSIREHKYVLLYLGHAACMPCHKLKRDVLEEEKTRALLDGKFIIVSIDCAGELKNRMYVMDLIKRYNVGSFPNVLILDQNGEIRHRIVGYDNKIDFLYQLRDFLD